MTARPVISDASPLIALTQISQLNILHVLFTTVMIPPAVARETARSVPLPPWLQVRELAQPIDPRIVRTSLGPGESQAISLGLEVGAQRVILDDVQARRTARALGLPLVGTLGVLLAAKRRRLLPSVQPHVEALLRAGFFVAPSLYEDLLVQAGEA